MTTITQGVADAMSIPKAAPADSFVLHAQLELMARTQLLSYVPAADRRSAVERIEWLAAQYAHAGDPVAPPPAIGGLPDSPALLAAVAAGDQDLVDAMAAAWLPRWTACDVACAIAEELVPSLAGAGHTPIGISLLLRDPSLPTTLLRGPLRSLAAQPGWRITWHQSVRGNGDANGLYAALRAAPQLGRPGSDFIHPLMTQAEESGEAERLLGPVLADRYDVRSALRTVTRVAAWSMLHDDQNQAPYGWTHALTMPQAVFSLAGVGISERTALAIAGTFALGFRVAHGTVELPPVIRPTSSASRWPELAAAAALHEDAHLVKFTLACIYAAAADPEFEGLYLDAAANLVQWWRAA